MTTLGRRIRGGNHTLLYLVLGALVLLPVAAFAIGPLSGDSFSLRGPAGPALAFSAGLLSFLSPCVLPLVPVYITHLSGATFEHGRLVSNRRATFSHALVFVSGFSAIFILLGVSVGLLGSYFITDHQREFEQVAGAVLIGLGILLVPAYGKRSPTRSVLLLAAVVVVFFVLADLASLRGQTTRLVVLALLMTAAWLRFSGYLEVPAFQRTFQVDLARGTGAGYSRSLLVGGSFALGWTPCIGPVLASIRTIHRGEFDAVHIHYAYLGMLGVLGKFPYILHCHGSDVREITPFTRPMVATALRHASHVFYATPDLADFVTARRPDAEFLPNPVDSDQFQPLAPSSESNEVFIACSLNDIKGARRILKACQRMSDLRPDIRVTAYAGGEYTEAFRKLPNVRLIPHQARENLPEIISRHGVVIGQVLLGVVGMAELEAMACGRPVVCWYTYNDAYDERPPFVRAVDGFDIAQSAIRLVDDATRRQAVGDEGRGWVQHYHNVDATARRVEEVLSALHR